MSQVTIAITATGRPDFLRTALQTVQNQIALKQIGEVLVSENSNDRRTEDAVREFPRLPSRYLFRQPTLPLAEHWFSTLRQARTPYVAILNDDDWWSAGHLEEGLRELTADANAVSYATSSLFVANEAHKNPRWIDRSAAMWLLAGKPSWTTTWSLAPELMLALCWVYTPFHVSSLIARTDSLLAVLDEFGNDTANNYTIDRLVFARLSVHGTFRYNPVPATYVRWHEGNLVNKQSATKTREFMQSTMHFVERLASQLGSNPADIWKSKLSSMPGEAELEILERLRETFTMDELNRRGLAGFFHRRPTSCRLRALRNIGSNTKRFLLGCS